jgi:hypothetical protein
MVTAQQSDGAYAVDTHRGTSNHRVSSQWFSRPDDQKFLSLDALHARVMELAEHGVVENVMSNDIRVEASGEHDIDLLLPLQDDKQRRVRPTHWSFSQLCQLSQVPAGYLRRLPSKIAGINLQYGLSNFRSELVKAYSSNGGEDVELRAATGPDYGRIYDHEVVKAVQEVAGNGVGDTRWKVPGRLDWGTGMYDPDTPVSMDTTTLFASDRDVFLFLVDDKNPIEIGKLDDGKPDLVFRGFFVYNSEVGSKSFGVATMYLRAVCCNRILWGVEGFQEIMFRHSKGAPSRFMAEVRPALQSYADASTGKLLEGIKTARETVVADSNEKAKEFLQGRNFTKGEADSIIEAVTKEEHHEPRSAWDFVQGISSVARRKGHQDARVDFEKKATKILDKTVS